MDPKEQPPITPRQQIKLATENFDRKTHPGIHDAQVIDAAVELLDQIYRLGRDRGIAPAAWAWTTNLPLACLTLSHARLHPQIRGLHP